MYIECNIVQCGVLLYDYIGKNIMNCNVLDFDIESQDRTWNRQTYNQMNIIQQVV